MNRDENGQERKTDFHYRSVIGGLNYLAGATRPDIQFAVHQCARFVEKPKMSHQKEVKRIVRYLKRTQNQGLIMSVDTTKGIECFVDADFAGGCRILYQVECIGSRKIETPTRPKLFKRNQTKTPLSRNHFA